jgi:hypothetical protein
MLLHAFDLFLKVLLGLTVHLVAFNQVSHNLVMGLLLISVNGFDFELNAVYFSL